MADIDPIIYVPVSYSGQTTGSNAGTKPVYNNVNSVGPANAPALTPGVAIPSSPAAAAATAYASYPYPIMTMTFITETDWNLYLPPNPLPDITAVYKEGQIWGFNGGYLGAAVFKILGLNSGSFYHKALILAVGKDWKNKNAVGDQIDVGSPISAVLIQDADQKDPRSLESLYGPKVKPIDLNYYKHKCHRCNSPALIMFRTIDCSKCGEI